MKRSMRNDLTTLILTGIVLCCSCNAAPNVTSKSPPNNNNNNNNNNASLSSQQDEVKVKVMGNLVVLENNLVQINFSNPSGNIIGLKYGGIDILEKYNNEGDRGYWDIVWDNVAETVHIQNKLPGTQFRVVTKTPEQIEVSFFDVYESHVHRDNGVTAPVNIDKRFILQRGRSGFYTYAIIERLQGWPGGRIETLRVAFKLSSAKFRYMAVTDTMQRYMPTADDRLRGKALAYKEAVLFGNKTSRPEFAGEVDDKYQYSLEDKDIKVHGWISLSPSVGFWMITPSDEFQIGGPFKQDLTSHVGPTTMTVFSCSHYVGRDIGLIFKDGETWKKVLGPVYVYLNSANTKSDNNTVIKSLWNNAKAQMVQEEKSWPYSFVASHEYLQSHQRGSVSGKLQVNDKYMPWFRDAKSAYIGLAPPGAQGSFQTESKGYQFWTQADDKGNFFIDHVRPGHYNLFASVPGVVGDFKYEADIEIKPGSKIQLGTVTYHPPRKGPTLWEIGIPDRLASEFNVPDPYPNLTNNLYKGSEFDKFRQYGLWARYTELYPKNDLVYKVGASNYKRDWFYAQVPRLAGENKHVGTTWQVQFDLNDVKPGNYTLQVAIASATYAELIVRANDMSCKPIFTTGLFGEDNAIARHGIHGIYWFWSVGIPSTKLHKGSNTIYLTQPRGGSPLFGIQYDYLRLEGPA